MQKKDLIIACDFPSREDTFRFLDRFPKEQIPFVKIGMELFYAAGPDMVRELKARGHNVFLDLKLHDIPNTVQSAMRVLAGLGADIVNLHASGTTEMMKAALQGLTEGAKGARPLLIAVTQLTSTSQAQMEQDLLIQYPLAQVVSHYAKNAKAAGLDGVVCSPLESEAVKAAVSADFLTVTPGIRYPTAGADDQTRITTPEGARAVGSDYIVVGRPITAAADPVAAYQKMRREFLGL